MGLFLTDGWLYSMSTFKSLENYFQVTEIPYWLGHSSLFDCTVVYTHTVYAPTFQLLSNHHQSKTTSSMY